MEPGGGAGARGVAIALLSLLLRRRQGGGFVDVEADAIGGAWGARGAGRGRVGEGGLADGVLAVGWWVWWWRGRGGGGVGEEVVGLGFRGEEGLRFFVVGECGGGHGVMAGLAWFGG